MGTQAWYLCNQAATHWSERTVQEQDCFKGETSGRDSVVKTGTTKRGSAKAREQT